jgi:hypothetical protein
MSKTNNYLWNETERHIDLVEKGACETLLQAKFTDVNTKEEVIDKIADASAKVLVSTNEKGWIMLSLIADEFDTQWRKIRNHREKSDFELANFLNVYDIKNYGYRKINLGTLYYIRIRNDKFLVKATDESRLDHKEPEVMLEYLP